MHTSSYLETDLKDGITVPTLPIQACHILCQNYSKKDKMMTQAECRYWHCNFEKPPTRVDPRGSCAMLDCSCANFFYLTDHC